jgi:small subunit ribosomal protein S14
MAKRNMVEREKRRSQQVAKDEKKREKLRVILKDPSASYEDKQAASVTLQKLPRDGSYTRQRNRCAITGRTRGVYKKFGLARHKLREAAMRGEVPGLKKASW